MKLRKRLIPRINVIHFRIPVRDEPGLELVPGTHTAWDTNEEYGVRLEKNGHKCSEELSTGVKVPLEAGDLFVFSANMIHRGLYGGERLAFDILFCDQTPDLLAHANIDCLPLDERLAEIPNSGMLAVTRRYASGS